MAKYDWQKLEPVLFNLHVNHGISLGELERTFGFPGNVVANRFRLKGYDYDRQMLVEEKLKEALAKLGLEGCVS